MSLEFERAAYLEFATTLTQWMKKNEGENIQFYVWDNRCFPISGALYNGIMTTPS